MLTEMAGEFPSLTRVFVDERDIYLAHSLKRCTKMSLGPAGRVCLFYIYLVHKSVLVFYCEQCVSYQHVSTVKTG